MNRGYSKQRRLTGRTPETYTWVDRQQSFAGTRAFPRAQAPRAQKRGPFAKYESIWMNALMYITIIFVVLGLFMEIGKLSKISSQIKLIDRVKYENTELIAQVENLEVEYGMEMRFPIIKQRAEEMLGMLLPEEADMHVLQEVKRNTADEALTAEGMVHSR